MITDGLTLDQIQVFLIVADQGSFSAASRSLGRAQSAITYAVQRLEEQIGTSLFDRSGYRAVLTEAGAALLPRACRIAQEVAAFRAQAHGLTEGLEPELTLVVDAMFPTTALVAALTDFRERYPTVPTRIYVESLGAAAALVADGTCTIGLLLYFAAEDPLLSLRPIARVRMVAVAAPQHPLALMPGPIPTDDLQAHVQLVLTDRSGRTGSRDHGVLSSRTWRLGDLGAKHALLLGGLGWGGMPWHMVEADVAAGRLRIILPEEWQGNDGGVPLQICVAHRTDRSVGPAGRWLIERLMATQDETIAEKKQANGDQAGRGERSAAHPRHHKRRDPQHHIELEHHADHA
jgi:DNA-binding transcriptional LysR family regulator